MSERQLGMCTSAAFFMEGLHDVGYDTAIDAWQQGALELVQEMVQHAPLADKLCTDGFNANPEGMPGVFDYEVSNAFGMWFGEYVIEHCAEPSKAEAEHQLRWLANCFFNQ